MNKNNFSTPHSVADTLTVLERLASGKPLGADAYRRIRERAERITEELRQKHGEMNVAVDLIRKARDEA